MSNIHPVQVAAPVANVSPAPFDLEKSQAAIANVDGFTDEKPIIEDDGSTHKQAGVKAVEGITTVWSKKTLWLMFALLYLVSFADSFVVSIDTNLSAYITSELGKHSLLSTISIVASILGSTSCFTIAKIIDIWGRVEGFIAMVVLVMIGLIMKATCQSVPAYAAAHTFYWVGHLNLIYVIDITLADMTTLKNRMLMLTINGTPTICTTFAGPAIAQLFYDRLNFRWAFGAFCIILVASAIPIATVMLWNQRKAKQVGVIPPKESSRTTLQSIMHYAIEFDVAGIILMTAGWSLVLLPFSIASSVRNTWANPGIICMFVFGVLSMIAFVLHEKYLAPVQFFPFRYLKDRTIIGACMVYGVMFISIFCWNGYYGSYLQVVHNQSITTSGYILNSFSLSAAILSPAIGYLISRTGDFKWTGMVGIPFIVLGTALLIPFRTPSAPVGVLVMCQIFMGVSTGIFATCAQLAIMSSVTHQEIAVAVALWGMFGGIGSSIGFTIAGGIWTNTLLDALARYLPEGSKDLATSIYSSLSIQQEWPMGVPIRDATILAYAHTQRLMVIAGSCFIPFVVLAVLVWKSINVRKLEEERGTQAKGTIF